MEKGKFSQPRPYRDEERQIEEAFRQITEQGQKSRTYQPKFARDTAPEETILLSAEELGQAEPEPLPSEELVQEEPISVSEPQELIPGHTPAKTKKAAVTDFLFPGEEMEFEEEDFEETEETETFLDRVMHFCNGNRKWILAGLCALALVLIVAVISVFAFGGSGSSAQIMSADVFIAGTNIHGMTRKQAVNAVERATARVYENNDMVVDLAGTKINFSQADTDARLDVNAAVDAAFQTYLTESGSDEQYYVALLPYLNLNTAYIHQLLNACATDTGSSLTQTSYGLEGAAPDLTLEKFNADSAQTLVITMGTPGISFDVESVYNQILDAYSMFQFTVTATDVEPAVEPEPIDLQDVYEEFYIEPVDSTINMQTFEVIPGTYGYEFDLMSAQKLLEQAQYGEVIRIPMLFIEPKQLEEDILFRDILGEFQTALTSDRNRTTNIRLACEALNGTVLEPGETFSFNETVGQPASGKGYQMVSMQEGHDYVDVLGGGISQSASTLYNCALLADLEIISRTNHNFPVDYVDYGLDAAVSYGGADLKFRNNQNYPIRIEAAVSGSYVTVRILGTDERDYYIRMESEVTATHKPATRYEDFEYNNAEGYLDGDVIRKGITGYSVKTYKLKYNRLTGTLKSRDYETSSRYATVDMLVARVAEPETTVPETTVPPTTAPPATLPPVTVPPETTAPPVETLPQETIASETQPLLTEPVEQQQETQSQDVSAITESTVPAE